LNVHAEVTGFASSLGLIDNVPIVTAALAYDCMVTYQTYILIFSQSLYMKELTTHLLCPNQMRSNGIIVNDCPLQYLPNHLRTKESHCIIADDLRIPLFMRGVISYFNVRCPNQQEMDNPHLYPHIHMTPSTSWSPYDEQLSRDESELALIGLDYHSPSTSSRMIEDVHTNFHPTYALNESCIASLMTKYILIDKVVMSMNATRKGSVNAKELSHKWFIGLNSASRTIDRTTQRGVLDFTHISGMKRMKHTAHQLMYKHIRAEIYTDTMFNKTKSLCQNTCAQVYVTRFHWTRVYPMRAKAEAHITLDRLHNEVGVFHTIIPDNAPELTAGEFKKKAIHAGSQIKPIEAYTHNQNLAESAIRELRRMYRKAMTTTNAPHVLWDHCLMLMAEIRSCTCLDLPELEGDSPATRLTGDTVDISHLCEFRWYDMVWYLDPLDKAENKKLGRYLGPSHDVGQAMCCKILNVKGKELSRTSVLPLSTEDVNNEICKQQISQFNKDLAISLGDRARGIALDPNDEVPEYEPYWDESMDANTNL
jgi:hypothetical protein